MASNAIVKSLTLTASWQKISDVSLVGSVTIALPRGNSGDASVRVSGGSTETWPKDTSAVLAGVDLSTIEFKGTAGDLVLVSGNTR